MPTSVREIHDYFYSLIGKREGDPADDYKAVLQRLVDQGMQVNFRPGEQANQNPDATFRGIKIVKDASGAIRGTIQVPAHQADQNNYFTHEFLLIRDRVQGQPPFVGPFDWGWDDRGGGTPYLLDEADTGGGDGGDGGDGGGDGGGGTDPALEARVAALESALADLSRVALKDGDGVSLEASGGMLLCAEGGGPEEPNQRFILTSRQAAGAWEIWILRRK